MVERLQLELDKPIDTERADTVEGIRVIENEKGRQLTVQIEGEMDQLLAALAGHKVSHFETYRRTRPGSFLTARLLWKSPLLIIHSPVPKPTL